VLCANVADQVAENMKAEWAIDARIVERVPLAA
jgi:hypothetical protein